MQEAIILFSKYENGVMEINLKIIRDKDTLKHHP